MQDGHPIAFISKALSVIHKGLSVYEKELLTVFQVVKKWHHYLSQKKFTIRTDHKSLKYLLEQWNTTTLQQKYIAKLINYDFDKTYKQGKENTLANALWRLPTAELVALVVSSPMEILISEIKESWKNDNQLQKIIEELHAGREVDV